MKIRKGFVSNSSTTSFTCDVCGEEVSGQDMSASEAEMIECAGGHVYCEHHSDKNYMKKLTKESVLSILEDCYCEDSKIEEIEKEIESLSESEFKKWLENEGGEILEEEISSNGETPCELCAVCNMEILTQDMMVDYLAKTTNITRDEVFRIIKQENKRRKKLYPIEYIEYVAKKQNTTEKEFCKEIKSKFKTYDELHTFIYG